MSDLETRLRAIEKAVSALQASQSGEQLQPNYLTTTPQGQIGALFSGGVQIPEQTGTAYQAGAALGFAGVDGGIPEFLLGTYNSGNGRHTLLAESSDGGFNAAELQLTITEAGQPPAAGASGIFLGCSDSSAGIPSANALLLDSLGRSQFIQGEPGAARTQILGQPAEAYISAATSSLTLNTWVEVANAVGATWTIANDPGSHINVATGRYRCPSAGTYLICGQVRCAAAAGLTLYSAIGVQLAAGGTTVLPSRVGTMSPGTASAGPASPVMAMITLSANDSIWLAAFSAGAAGALAWDTGGTYTDNYLNVVQVA